MTNLLLCFPVKKRERDFAHAAGLMMPKTGVHRVCIGKDPYSSSAFVVSFENVKWPNIRHTERFGTPGHIEIHRRRLPPRILLCFSTVGESAVRWHEGSVTSSVQTFRGLVQRRQRTVCQTLLDHLSRRPCNENALPRWRGQYRSKFSNPKYSCRSFGNSSKKKLFFKKRHKNICNVATTRRECIIYHSGT